MIPFGDFWNFYDKKVGIDKCKPKWELLAMHHEEIMIHLDKFIPNNRNKQYRPNPLTYLNQSMWKGEIISNEEPKEVYKEESLKVNGHIPNKYKAKEFNRNDYRRKVEADLTSFYKTGTPILDAGNIMHQKLTELKILTLTEETRTKIRDYWEHEFTRKRSRLEDELRGSVESEIKRNELNVYLKSTNLTDLLRSIKGQRV